MYEPDLYCLGVSSKKPPCFTFLSFCLQTEQVERNYIKEKKAAVKEFDDKKVELKENLIAELEEKKKMIENEKLTMELTGGKGARTGLLIRNLLSRRKRNRLKCVTGREVFLRIKQNLQFPLGDIVVVHTVTFLHL